MRYLLLPPVALLIISLFLIGMLVEYIIKKFKYKTNPQGKRSNSLKKDKNH